MRILNFFIFITIVIGCSQKTAIPEKDVFQPFSSIELEEKVNTLLSNMSLDEKLAQIEGIRPKEIMEDGKFSIEKCREVIPHGIGHFCQFSSGLTMSPTELRDFVREVQRYLVTETRMKIPAIFHEEAITGFATQGATTFPQQIGMGCTWNPELIEQNTASTAKIMRSAGATYALSPMLDIARTAHWGRIEESYGEDAYLTSRLGVAFVNGLQGPDLRTGVAATAKHFVGYGTQNGDRKELYEEYLMPHEAVIKLAGVKSVMPSYGKYNGLAVVANKEMITTMLREEVGFDGLVVSDYGAINLVYKGHKQAKSSMHAGALAINAGTDIEFSTPICFPLLPAAIDSGLVALEKIDDAVRRSLTMKAKLGLLDEKLIIGQDGQLNFDSLTNRKLAYESACQSIVLLKNDGTLPLKKGIKKIALVGPNAATVHGLLGDYTYQSMISFWHSTPFDPNDPKLVSLKEGLESRLEKGIKLSYELGCDWSSPLESIIDTIGLGDDRLSKVKMIAIKGLPQPDLNNALKIANESDVIIAAVGENIYLCGEGRERSGIDLPGDQEAFVQKLIATGKPVVLIVFGGRPQVISKFEKDCAAIIQAWFPGEEGGNALADIIVGNVNPSGKLCVTYPRTGDKQELNYKNGYGAHPPQYPFGYGLSYTNFEYSDIVSSGNSKTMNEAITLTLKVRNIGTTDGTEIVQLYVSPIDQNSTMKPIQLKGFQRIALKKGEEKEVEFSISPELLVQYIGDKWIVESGRYLFKIGASCTDIRLTTQVDLEGQNLTLKGRKTFFSSNL